MNYDLAGKVAVVTGGTSGTGAAITTAFIKAGAKVIFTGWGRSPHQGIAGGYGPGADGRSVDAGSAAQMKALLDDVAAD